MAWPILLTGRLTIQYTSYQRVTDTHRQTRDDSIHRASIATFPRNGNVLTCFYCCNLFWTFAAFVLLVHVAQPTSFRGRSVVWCKYMYWEMAPFLSVEADVMALSSGGVDMCSCTVAGAAVWCWCCTVVVVWRVFTSRPELAVVVWRRRFTAVSSVSGDTPSPLFFTRRHRHFSCLSPPQVFQRRFSPRYFTQLQRQPGVMRQRLRQTTAWLLKVAVEIAERRVISTDVRGIL